MPKLYYFDLYGRAEEIRQALTLCGVAFEDVRVTGQTWLDLKVSGKCEFGQVPVLELDDGTCLSQGASILNYLNSTLCTGLQQNDDALKVHFAHSLANYWANDYGVKNFTPIIYGHVFNPASEEEARKTAFTGFIDTATTAAFEHAERRLQTVTTTFLLGDKPSMYDINICNTFCLMHQEGKEDDRLAPLKEAFKKLLNNGKYPKLVAYAQAYFAALKEYLAARPQCVA